MNFIVKEENFNDIVMSNDFVTLDKPLMVEIIRKRVIPGRMNDFRVSKLSGKTCCDSYEVKIENYFT